MDKATLLKISILGTVVSALCCFTPLLVLLFGVIGLSAWVGYLDAVLLPTLIFFIGLIIYALLKKDKPQEEDNDKKIIPDSTITCPKCGFSKKETMPTNACQWFYECTSCHVVLKPKSGDCCVYCSYGDVPCPPIQQKGDC